MNRQRYPHREPHRMNCLVCLRELPPMRSTEPDEQHPDDAVVFYSKGNYGSTVYDEPFGTQSLELYVCDDCMRERDEHIFTMRPVLPRRRKAEFIRGVHSDRDCYAPFQEAIAVLRRLDAKGGACPLCKQEGGHAPTCDLGELMGFARTFWPDDPRSPE